MSPSSVAMRRAARSWSLAVALLALAALSSMVPGCDSATPSKDASGRRALKLQLNWFPEPEFGGFYAARESGAFERRGLDVELLAGGADVPGPQLLAAGQVDAAIVSASQLLTLRASGGRVVAISAAFQKTPRCIVVRDDSRFESLEELWKSDARLMAGDGLPYLAWLESRFGPSGLQRVPYTGSLAPFLAGDVQAMQAFATAEPVQLEVDGVATRVFLVADTGFDPYDGILAVREEMLEREPAVVAALAAAVAEGWDSYLSDPAPVNRLIAELNPDFTDRTLSLAAAKLPAFVRSPDTARHRFGWMTETRWTTLADQLRRIGDLDDEERASLGTIFVNPMETEPAPGSGSGTAG